MRDCAAVAEQEHQEWATEMQDFLLDLHDACQEWRLLHLTSIPAIERDEWVARYFEILAAGYAAQPPPPASSAGSHKGRRKQSKAKNLLDALLGRAEQVLALLDDLRIPSSHLFSPPDSFDRRGREAFHPYERFLQGSWSYLRHTYTELMSLSPIRTLRSQP